jgi:hypothetical protein
MQSTDYLDWSQVSGLYYQNRSHTDRYRTFQPLISAAGLNVVIVAEFLKDNDDGLNPAKWRTSSVYEMFDEMEQRLQFTANALHAIGATRTGTTIAKTSKPISPYLLVVEIGPYNPENLAKASVLAEERAKEWAAACESHAEVQSLLERYTTVNTADLEGDIARHGDPRQRPGYNRENRLAELDALRRREWMKKNQQQKSVELTTATRDLEKKLTKAGSDPKSLKRVGKQRGDYRKLINSCREIAPEDRTSEMTQSLDAAEKFVTAREDFFHPAMTQEAELNTRLAALGTFEGDPDEDPCEVSWESPKGFKGAWGDFSLTLTYPPGKTKLLAKLLTASERLPAKLPELSEQWFRDMISNFHEVYAEELDDEERVAYAFDASGKVTDASLRQHAGKGQIQLQYEDGEFFAQTWFGVAWDKEHGYPIEWDEALLKSLLK